MSTAAQQKGCIFCSAVENADQPDSLIIFRGKHNFIILNRFPYNNGHLMIAPYHHIPNPADAEPEIVEEMIRLSQRVIHALRAAYKPDGFNMGMNLGKCGGAGVEEHYHLHVVPRWDGDTNFMATVAETRVIPEDFATSMAKLKPYFTEDL